MTPSCVVAGRRVHFAWTALPRNVANRSAEPRRRFTGGVADNDNNEPRCA